MKKGLLVPLLMLTTMAILPAVDRDMYLDRFNRVVLEFTDGADSWSVIVGGGGSISEIRGNTGRDLIAKPQSVEDGKTGRVMQELLFTDHREPNGNPANNRNNVNQAGSGEGRYAPVTSVEWNQTAKWLKVWTTPQDQWRSVLDDYFDCRYSMLTHYQMNTDGTLLIRTYVYFDQWLADGQIPDTVSVNHWQAWTPFAISAATFDSCAVQLNADGSPTAGKYWNHLTMPFGHGSVTGESGYATMFHNSFRGRDVISLVYGTQDVYDFFDESFYLLNIRGRSGILPDGSVPMMAINPGIYVGHMDPPTYISRSKVLVFGSDGLTADYKQLLDNKVKSLARPIIQRSPRNNSLINGLKSNLTRSGLRSHAIGTLID